MNSFVMKDLLRFLKSTAICLLLLSLLDIVTGMSLYKTYETLPSDYPTAICKAKHAMHTDAEVVIFGSSRASYHYESALLRDSINHLLNVDYMVYNAGVDGKNITFHSSVYQYMLKNNTPKIIILDVNPFELTNRFNVVEDLGIYYFKDEYIRSVINAYDPKNRILMCSNLFRYNTIGMKLCTMYFISKNNYTPSKDGYRPLPEDIHPPAHIENKEQNETKEEPVQDINIACFKDFIQWSKEKNIKLIITLSPEYNPNGLPLQNTRSLDVIRIICENNNIQIHDYRHHPEISHNSLFFRDEAHMNQKGANEYTKFLFHQIKNDIYDSCLRTSSTPSTE